MRSGFGTEIDYAMLIKLYGPSPTGTNPETRYSPPKCIGARPEVKQGDPDPMHISTRADGASDHGKGLDQAKGGRKCRLTHYPKS